MEGNSKSLKNGLQVSIDWLSFTVTEISCVDSVLALLGYRREDFNQLPHGLEGYKSLLRLNGYPISILYDGNEGMGIHVKVSGSAISELIRSFKTTMEIDTPFGPGYDIDFESTFMLELLSAIRRVGHFTRIDLAIDDIGSTYFTTDDISSLWEQHRIVTRFRQKREEILSLSGNIRTGHILRFGSRKSELYLRIYDKQLEQNEKHKGTDVPVITTPWVRWEMECKGSRANSVVCKLLDGLGLGEVAIGVLSHYFRIIELDDSNRTRCSINEKWQAFVQAISPLKLYVPSEEKTMSDKRDWVNHQVMPTIAAILICDGGSLEFFEKYLPDGVRRMKKNLRRLVDQELSDSASDGGGFNNDSCNGS